MKKYVPIARSLSIFAGGVIVGCLVWSWIDTRERSSVHILSAPGEGACEVEWGVESKVSWLPHSSFLDGGGRINCNEVISLPSNVVVLCVCR